MSATRQEVVSLIIGSFFDAEKYQPQKQLKKLAEQEGIDLRDRPSFVEWIGQKLNGQKQEQKSTTPNGRKPIWEVVTIPGSLGETFDQWLAEGWDCANCVDEKHPDGQLEALEVLRGYDEDGGDARDFRNQTLDTLSPKRTNYYSFLKDKHKRWLRSR
jgi:hypothetical protein